MLFFSRKRSSISSAPKRQLAPKPFKLDVPRPWVLLMWQGTRGLRITTPGGRGLLCTPRAEASQTKRVVTPQAGRSQLLRPSVSRKNSQGSVSSSSLKSSAELSVLPSQLASRPALGVGTKRDLFALSCSWYPGYNSYPSNTSTWRAARKGFTQLGLIKKRVQCDRLARTDPAVPSCSDRSLRGLTRAPRKRYLFRTSQPPGQGNSLCIPAAAMF